MTRVVVVVALATVLAVGCGGSSSGPTADAPPDVVTTVNFMTSKGAFVVDAHRALSPNGVDRFLELVNAGFYDNARFFRVIAGFVAQFGINGTPATNAMFSDSTIPDDPVAASNTRGFITFAQTSLPNSRTTQLFVNLVDNSQLDGMGFAPFAMVTSGMDVVDSLDSEYGEAPDQGQITEQGNSYLDANFPNLDFIITAKVQ